MDFDILVEAERILGFLKERQSLKRELPASFLHPVIGESAVRGAKSN